uniref:Apolipoprotein B100 C-terminal domain-containing protein n=1 Tax=Xenopus tropicalis TaxID=8364 RepID=A0A6I8RKY6_XENTR
MQNFPDAQLEQFKIEFLNNYNFILNTNVQQISWQVNGRFNQYKVSHTISVGNNEDSVVAIVGMNGEANLDFLTIPISIPEMNVPYTSMKTPEVKDFSLWEQAGLKKLLTTTKQNVDLNVKLQYKKNMDVHSIQLPLDSLYDSINSNMKVLTKNFEKGRDNTLRMLTDSYNEAKAKFDKYKVENSAGKAPRTIRVPGYTIPLLNIEVSPFSAELPAFGYVIPKEISTPSFSLPVMGFSIPTYTVVLPSLELPVLHVPNTLRKLTLPKLKLPSGPHTISIPAMGNLTYDFSFKSNVISLTTSAGLYNQSDLSARISVASTSIINALQFTIDGTTGLTRKRGLKLATALAVKHVFVDGKHESSMSLGKRNIEASVVTNAKVSLPIIQLTFKQEIGLNGDGTFHTIILAHNVKLSNDKTDARFQIDGSLQGHASMLKYVILPVYEKSLWEILKFDVTTSEDKQQYLNVSTSVTYTKNKEGFWFPIPINKVADGFVIKFPAVTLKPPQWMKDLPNTMRDMELPEVPSVLEIPSFKVPFTNLNVPSTKLDLNNIKISEIKSTLPFDINLPSLPQIKFPKVDITTKYITVEEYKIPFFEVTIPQHQITLARYTLPKSFYNIDFNSLVNKIADIDLPTIEIPEQNIEIPPIKMNLPAGIFIPAFGALAGTAQLSSPIYNLTWTNKMANNADGFVASIDASSSSTLRFLEYDLDASASTAPTNGLVLQGTFAHTDLSINWKDDINFNGLRIPGHNIDIDIKSPTFTDVQIRSQQENNKITSSVSSSSAGTLGLVLEKESSALKGKLFSRSLSTPGKDTLIMKGEVSLKNPERIQYKINWREEAAMDVLNGLKERLPKISNSIHNCVNKYHKEHFGMEISEAGLKMKENLQDKIASTYRSTANEINNIEYQLQSTARGASDKYNEIVNSAQKWYQDPKDMSMFLNDGEYKDKAIELVRAYQNKMKDLIDAAIKFVKNTRFQLPGQSRKYTGEELFNLGMKNVASNIDAFFKAMQQIYDACVQYINRTELKIPGTEVTIKGKEITDACKSFSANLERMTKKAIQDLQGVSLESALNQLKSFIQVITQKTVDMIKALQTKNIEDVKLQFQQMYSDAMKSDYARELQNLVEELKKATSQLQKYAQTGHEELSEKLKQLQVYAKALREEYLDPNIVGWSVKYYEIEEKVIQLLQKIVDSLKDLSSQYGINTAEITEQTKDFVKKYYQHANDLLTNANGQGKELIRRASIDLEDRVTKWSATARQLSQNANKILNEKLQATSNLFVNSYEKLIAEASRLIDIIIQNYNSFIEYVNQLLQSIQNSATEEMKTYISTRKGELKVEVPHPFDWKSFDEIPHLREDIISKRAEIARAMVLDGIDKGSQKWEELQQFIERQLQEGKLTAEQIIENIRNWQKN